MHAVLLVLLLLLVFASVIIPLLCLLLLHMRMPQLCMVHGIQELVGRVPREGGYQRWGFRFGRRFASCLGGGGRSKCSPAGCARGQVAGSLPGKQPCTGTRRSSGGAVTPSIHPEVLDSLFVSPGRGNGIRQLMGWRQVCGSAGSGIRVLKGDARARMSPANLDHLRVGWRKQGSPETAWVTPGHDCLCSYAYGHGAAVGWGYWFVVQGRTPLVALVCKREYANGGEPEPIRQSRIMHSLA